MKNRLDPPLHRSFKISLLAMLLLVVFTPSNTRAQSSSPYDPCAPQISLETICHNGVHYCDPLSPPMCSEGYCWASGNILPNQGIPAGGIVSDKVIEIGGAYTITQSVKFINCQFYMHGESSINVNPTGSSLFKITFENCDFFGCAEMWYGITINTSNASTGLLFNFTSCLVEDAYIGLMLDEARAGYFISDSKFNANYIGISNRLQNGSTLNAVLVRNEFTSQAKLADRVGAMQNLPFLDGPFSHAGIKYILAQASIGVQETPTTGNTENIFGCLTNGIVTEGGSVVSSNNIFSDMRKYGIWATEGSIASVDCFFKAEGIYCIYTNGANLTARHNEFSGKWTQGIHCENNLSAEVIRIDQNNTFIIASGPWEYGIYVERSHATNGEHCIIDHNTFNITGSVGGVSCIFYKDLVNASDEAKITWNTMNINSTHGANHCVEAIVAHSDKIKIENNTMTYGVAIEDGFANFPVYLKAAGQQTSQLHEASTNTITGLGLGPDESVTCSFHCENINGFDFCENTVDFSFRGFHFQGKCNVDVRQNHINRHGYGIVISDLGGFAQIGIQHGHGNMWSTTADDCVEKAIYYAGAINPANNNPQNSRFWVPESEFLPFLPPPSKISPDPTVFGSGFNWVRYDEVGQSNYCQQAAPPRALSPEEIAVVNGTTLLTGLPLWELKLSVYTELLLFPELRPVGSSEETFFNSLTGTTIASIGQIDLLVSNALNLSFSDQQALDNFRQAIKQAWASIANMEGATNFLNAANLTETWFSNRAALLQQVDANADSEAAIEGIREQYVSQSLQSTLINNGGIASSQPYESARKTINDLRIRHLLRQPMTQSLYQQALALALQNAGTVGQAVRDVVPFLSPCDQEQFVVDDRAEQHTGNISKQKKKLEILKVLPNPANDWVEVEIPATTGVGLIRIFDSFGHSVRSLALRGDFQKVRLDLNGLTSGVYKVVLTDNTGKFIASSQLSLIR